MLHNIMPFYIDIIVSLWSRSVLRTGTRTRLRCAAMVQWTFYVVVLTHCYTVCARVYINLVYVSTGRRCRKVSALARAVRALSDGSANCNWWHICHGLFAVGRADKSVVFLRPVPVSQPPRFMKFDWSRQVVVVVGEMIWSFFFYVGLDEIISELKNYLDISIL